MVCNIFFLSYDTFVMSWKLDLNKMENGTLGTNLVPLNKVTKFEERQLIFIGQTQLKSLYNFKCFTVIALY